jgi:signal transduction histidine kinase
MSRSRNRRHLHDQPAYTEDSPLLGFSPMSLVPSMDEALTILVIDDDPATNSRITQVLEEYGYAVQSATNSSDLLELLRQCAPQVIIADVSLPQIEGHLLLNRIRGNLSTRETPVIFLVAQDAPEGRKASRDSGVVEYLPKPVDSQATQALVAVVDSVVQQHAAREAEIRRRVDEIRNQIIAMVQHEFRTPLTFVMGYAEFLQDGLQQNLPHEELESSVAAILEGSHRLHRLVESFLLLATLNQDKLPADEIYPLDPTALWRECITEANLPLRESLLQVKLSEPNDPVIVFGVMDLIREALMRLLDNAIRYRRAESRFIWLATVVQPGLVGWQIRDDGMGVPTARLSALSAPFMRGHSYQAESHGIGLGLALARRVAELHGGYLQIESQEGVGSTFTLWVSDHEVM